MKYYFLTSHNKNIVLNTIIKRRDTYQSYLYRSRHTWNKKKERKCYFIHCDKKHQRKTIVLFFLFLLHRVRSDSFGTFVFSQKEKERERSTQCSQTIVRFVLFQIKKRTEDVSLSLLLETYTT